MAFDHATPRAPTSIGTIVVTLKDRPATGGEPASKTVTYDVRVLDQNGQQMNVAGDSGDLAPHLTVQQINALIAFMADLRAKAQAEFLG